MQKTHGKGGITLKSRYIRYEKEEKWDFFSQKLEKLILEKLKEE